MAWIPVFRRPNVIIDHLCTSLSGGASVAAQRLHRSLRAAGVTSRFLHSPRSKAPVDDLYSAVPWQRPRGQFASLRSWITWCARKTNWILAKQRHLRGRPKGFEIFTPARLATDTALSWNTPSAELVHLHWVTKLIDYPSFFASLPDSLPVVWTLHDMNPLTGGCHFSSGCERFSMGCGNCPQLANPCNQDLSSRQFRIKQDALRGKNLHVVAPSRWLLECARQSPILKSARSFHHIPYGLDTESYSPRDKYEARNYFHIPQGAIVVGFGADDISNQRKGWQKLMEAFDVLDCTQPTVALVFGKGHVPALQKRNLTFVPVGFLRDTRELTNLYSAMDAFVLPSLEDNLPQTGLEAMSCGTPVVGFDAGGIPDFVLPQQTGWLARTGDAHNLAEQLQKVLDDPQTAVALGKNARKLIVERFNSHIESARYIDLYREIFAAKERGRQMNAA